jgi:hypothetical protein
LIYVVRSLNFGTVPKYAGLQIEDKEGVRKMKNDLVDKKIFCRHNVRVDHVIVNGIDYEDEHKGTILE